MRAVTRFADDATAALDLSDIARGDGFLFVRDGVGLAGRGVAVRASTDEMPALLASIEHDDRTAPATTSSPVAVGWVPYDPAAPGELIVPAVTVRKTADGRRLVTVIDDAVECLPAPARAEPVGVGVHDRPRSRRSTATSAAVGDGARRRA